MHADGDEEQAQQHIAERLDVLLDLVAVLGFGDQHAGDEGAECERQSGELGDRRQQQGDQQHVEHEQLGRLLRRHQMEPGAHQALPESEQQRQDHGRLEAGETEFAQDVGRRRRQRRQQDQQRHHGEILEQQHTHDAAAVRRVELELFRQHLAQDRGGRHRDRPSQGDATLGAETEPPRAGGDDQQCAQHLRRTEPEHQTPHRQQLGQAELEADREHQEHDPELAEFAGACTVGNPAERIWSDGDADRQIANQRRQPQAPAQRDHHHRRSQENQYQRERVMHLRADSRQPRSRERLNVAHGPQLSRCRDAPALYSKTCTRNRKSLAQTALASSPPAPRFRSGGGCST